jgi:hypothetical protein
MDVSSQKGRIVVVRAQSELFGPFRKLKVKQIRVAAAQISLEFVRKGSGNVADVVEVLCLT